MSSDKLLKQHHFLFIYALALLDQCTESVGGSPGRTARGRLGRDFVNGAEDWIASQKPVHNGSTDEACPAWVEMPLQFDKDPFVYSSGHVAAPALGRVEIRTMTFEDIGTVNRLGRDMFTTGEFCTMGRTWDDFSVVDVYVRSRDLCFVAETVPLADERTMAGSTDTDKIENDRKTTIVGFLLGGVSSKPETGSFGSFEWIAVVPDHRRKGVGTYLVRRFHEELRRLHQTSTVLARHTAANNAPAIRLLESSGLRHKIEYVSLTLPMPSVTYTRLNTETSSLEYRYEPSASRVKGRHTGNGTGSTSFTIRRIKIDDLESVRALGDDLFRAKPTLSREWNDDEILNHYLADSDYCLVATVKGVERSGDDCRSVAEDETLVGFSMGSISEDTVTQQNYGYFVWLGCASDYQGMGVATELFNAMLELFAVEEVDMVIMDTQSDNVEALRFFRKHGFGDDERHLYLSNTPLT
jgi:ribosomal protein S18 acetylase RimI-like enzyme